MSLPDPLSSLESSSSSSSSSAPPAAVAASSPESSILLQHHIMLTHYKSTQAMKDSRFHARCIFAATAYDDKVKQCGGPWQMCGKFTTSYFL